MAYIKDTLFAIRANNNIYDELANITGMFRNGSDEGEVCSAGFLCTRDEQLPHSAYPTLKNENAYYMVAATDAANVTTGVYACNTFDVNEVQDPATGNVYRVGANTLGLPIPANQRGTFTKIDFAANDKIYRFGAGNFSAAVADNIYFTIADGLLTPSTSAPTGNGNVYFELVASGTSIAGTYAAAGWYDLRARSVVA